MDNKKTILLIPLIFSSMAQQRQLMDIRNEPSVCATAFTDHEINIDEHLQWINRLKTDKKQIVFAIINEEDEAIGVISVHAIDVLHRKADWTFYLTSTARGGLGTAIEWHFIEFVFNKLNLQKLNGEVLEGNDYVIIHHRKFAFIEEGFRSSNIEKNGVRIGVHFIGLTKNDWIANSDNVFENHKSLLSKFDIRICWEESYNPIAVVM